MHEVAQGYLGSLWIALDQRGGSAGKPALLRRLQLPSATPPEVLQRMACAGRDAMAFSHENVLAVLAVLQEADALAVAYAYVEAEPLRSLTSWARQRGLRFPVAVSLRILLDLLRGVKALHGSLLGWPSAPPFGGLSPDSVLISRDGRTRLCDPLVASCASLLDGIGLCAEKLSYAAPEQVHATAPLAPPSDVFACGVMLWELLTGRRLLSGEQAELERKLLEHDLPPLRDHLADDAAASPALIELVERCLSSDAGRRPQTPVALAEALEQCGHEIAELADVARFIAELTGAHFEQRAVSVRAKLLASQSGAMKAVTPRAKHTPSSSKAATPPDAVTAGEPSAPSTSSSDAVAAVEPSAPSTSGIMGALSFPAAAPPVPIAAGGGAGGRAKGSRRLVPLPARPASSSSAARLAVSSTAAAGHTLPLPARANAAQEKPAKENALKDKPAKDKPSPPPAIGVSSKPKTPRAASGTKPPFATPRAPLASRASTESRRSPKAVERTILGMGVPPAIANLKPRAASPDAPRATPSAEPARTAEATSAAEHAPPSPPTIRGVAAPPRATPEPAAGLRTAAAAHSAEPADLAVPPQETPQMAPGGVTETARVALADDPLPAASPAPPDVSAAAASPDAGHIAAPAEDAIPVSLDAESEEDEDTAPDTVNSAPDAALAAIDDGWGDPLSLDGDTPAQPAPPAPREAPGAPAPLGPVHSYASPPRDSHWGVELAVPEIAESAAPAATASLLSSVQPPQPLDLSATRESLRSSLLEGLEPIVDSQKLAPRVAAPVHSRRPSGWSHAPAAPGRARTRTWLLAGLATLALGAAVAVALLLRTTSNDTTSARALESESAPAAISDSTAAALAAPAQAAAAAPPAAPSDVPPASAEASKSGEASKSAEAAEPSPTALPLPAGQFAEVKLRDEQLLELFALEQRPELPSCTQRLGASARRLRKSASRSHADLKAARRALVRGDNDQAQLLLCQATTRHAGNTAAWQTLAEFVLHLGDAAQAKQIAEQGLKAKRNDPALLGILGDAWAVLGDLEQSRALWGKSAKVKGGAAERERRLIALFGSIADRKLRGYSYGAALAYYRRAVVLSAGAEGPSVGMGEALRRRDQPRAAAAWSERSARAFAKPEQR